MPRILTYKDRMKRKRFSNKEEGFEEDLNNLISEAYEAGIPPDISINIMQEVNSPVVKIWFFRESDSIQSE